MEDEAKMGVEMSRWGDGEKYQFDNIGQGRVLGKRYHEFMKVPRRRSLLFVVLGRVCVKSILCLLQSVIVR